MVTQIMFDLLCRNIASQLYQLITKKTPPANTKDLHASENVYHMVIHLYNQHANDKYTSWNVKIKMATLKVNRLGY